MPMVLIPEDPESPGELNFCRTPGLTIEVAMLWIVFKY